MSTIVSLKTVSHTQTFFWKKNLKKFLLLLSSLFVILNIPLGLFAQQAQSASPKTISLFDAIRSGDATKLQEQISMGANVNDTLNDYSPLMAAALNGSVEQMRMLLDKGANVNYESSSGITALWLAVPDWDKTLLLIDHGADVNHKVGSYGVLAKLAAMPGQLKLFNELIAKGTNLRKSAADNMLVYNAAASGDTSILGFLLRSGFSAGDSIATGDYPINAATYFRSFGTLKMLVDNGADLSVAPVSSFGLEALQRFTPLMNAALSGERSSFLYLLDHGANPNAKNKQGFTVLMLLQECETDDAEMTLALIKHGAVVTDKAADGTDALYYAKQKGNTASVALLQKYFNK